MKNKKGGFSMLENYLVLRYSFTKKSWLIYVDYPFISQM